jgi:hypothetical protein
MITCENIPRGGIARWIVPDYDRALVSVGETPD